MFSFFFSSRRRHTRSLCDWSSDVCSSDLLQPHQGLPLMRLQGERIYQNQGVFDVISPNMFAGSILDLEPDTAYEARFAMSDPDGLVGQNAKTVTKTVTVRTRPEPKPYSGGRVFHIYPNDSKGTRIEPAFEAVMCAYNYYCGGGD